MADIENLFLLAHAYADATKTTLSTVSTRVFRDGKRFAQIASGADIGVRRCAAAMQWFSDNWPAGAEWPAGVNRPARSLEAAE